MIDYRGFELDIAPVGMFPAFQKGSMKPKLKANEKQPPKSIGTILSEKLRAKANKHTDQHREASIAEGMAIIYGGGNRHAKTVNRR